MVRMLCVLSLLAGGCFKKAMPSAEVNFISGWEGTITMRATGTGLTRNEAIEDAERKAFQVLLFRGLPGSDQHIALIGSDESAERIRHKAYFDQFYSEKRYRTFIMSSIPVTSWARFGCGRKSISVDLKINLIALRKDLEQFHVIRKFGY
jgi:hypothetical protein